MVSCIAQSWEPGFLGQRQQRFLACSPAEAFCCNWPGLQLC